MSVNRVLKWVGGVLGAYIVFVLLFESVFLGYFQPSFEEGGIPMLDLTVRDEAGNQTTRRLAWFESSDGNIYVSAHHWTRGWYHDLVANPDVSADIRGVTADFTAAIVTGGEFRRVAEEYPIPFMARFLMGFPPERDIVRLDPMSEL